MRTDGYLPIGDYALIGDGHTSALVGLDGSIDWLCLPHAGSDAVFDRILDADGGGRFELRPVERFEAVRRYRTHTNVLETTFRTAAGTLRLTDAMTRLDGDERELVRIADCLEGEVALQWSFDLREGRGGFRVHTWDGGDGYAVLAAGGRATFLATTGEPGTRTDAETAVERVSARWMDWASRAAYEGPWREEVLRSALVLKLLTYTPTGAILAAPTTSLPERIGGDLNWDYRYSWLRDGIYTMRALLSLGYREEAEAWFRWQIDAITPDVPRVRPLYRIDGTHDGEERELPLPGYLGSKPVRSGNGAAHQLQLDTYGHLLESASRLHGTTGHLDPDVGPVLRELADFVADSWRDEDAGIWEVRGGLYDFVQSKAMCWTALDRAASLADASVIPADGSRWRAEADLVRDWIESQGWDDKRETYLRAPALGDEVDAALLSLPLCAYSSAGERRFLQTAETVRRELGAGGPLVYRTAASAELEGAFTTCSFWLVDAYGRAGMKEEGHALMAELVALANDVGLYGEEIDPETGAQLGNFPQGLVHLALVNAAVSLEQGDEA